MAVLFCRALVLRGAVTVSESAERVPLPAQQMVKVDVAGRTSTLKQLAVSAVGSNIPRTFSRNLIGNTAGFEWYVSRHFAIKSDLPPKEVAESLALLEMALPHLEAIFGGSRTALAGRRLAFVFASSRSELTRAMISDDMHILRLGGITQEGFWGAYQYAGSPYQNRYIILHELVHLYQYSLAGNTRQFYGFFIEGIADLFSSHVYDPAVRQLTVNVLDRAPIHNHLAAGLAEWERRGRPSFSQLHAGGATSRGLDVLMTAFLQSTPAREQCWRIYCRQILQTPPTECPRQTSEEQIAALYGSWSDLDTAFAEWMERQPTFVQRSYGFDQQGELLVSQPSPHGGEALIELNPHWGTGERDDPFRCDYPATLPRNSLHAASQLSFALHHPGGKAQEGTIGVRSQAAAFEAAISAGRKLVVSAATNRLTVALSSAATTIDFEATADSLAVITPQGRQQLPLCASNYEALHAAPLTLFATAAGLSLAPLFPGAPVRGVTAPVSRLNCRPDSARFSSSPALGPLFRAAHALGAHAPPPLLTARNLLLADAAATAPTLPQEEFEQVDFWREMAQGIRNSSATPGCRNQALKALSDITLDLTVEPHAAVAYLKGPLVGRATGSLTWLLNGEHHSTTRIGTGDAAQFSLPWPVESKRPLNIAVRADVQWLGVPLSLSASRIRNPSITAWEVLGPFPLPEGRVSDQPLPPETTAPPFAEALFTAADGTLLTWQQVPAPATHHDSDHLLHFARLFRRQANFYAAYARTSFSHPSACKARLALGVSDGIQVWHNGVLIHRDFTLREWTPGNVIVPLTLVAGENSLVIKSIHGEGLWFLSARLQKSDGTALTE